LVSRRKVQRLGRFGSSGCGRDAAKSEKNRGHRSWKAFWRRDFLKFFRFKGKECGSVGRNSFGREGLNGPKNREGSVNRKKTAESLRDERSEHED